MNARGHVGLTAFVALLGGAGTFLAARHDAAPSVVASPTPRPLAWIRWTDGRVLVGGSSGGAVTAGGSSMSSDDQLATENDAHATLDLRLAGLLVLGPRAALQVLPEQWESDTLRPTGVRFLRGSARADAAAGAAGMRLDLGGTRVELAPRGRALVGWEDGETVGLSVLSEGAIVELRDGRQVVLSARQGLRLVGGVPDGERVALPAAPVVSVTSAKPKVVARQNGKAQPVFRFPGESGRIQVVVARDAALTEVVAEAEGKADAVQVRQGLAPGNYFWSAARVDEVSRLTGDYSESRAMEVVDGAGQTSSDAAPKARVVVAGPVTRIFYSGARPPPLGLDWPGTEDESGYDVSVAADPAFKKKSVISKTVETSALEIPVLEPGTWHWRIRGAETTFAGRVLLKKVARTTLSATTRRVDEEYKAQDIMFQRVVPAVQFSWKVDAARVARYRLKVARDAAFKDLLVQTEAAAPPLTLESGALPEGTLFWRAERLKADGSLFFDGKVMELKVRFDELNPDLEILDADASSVRGLAPKDCALSVNGVPVSADATGRFSAKVGAEDGQFVVRCAKGNERSYLVHSVR